MAGAVPPGFLASIQQMTSTGAAQFNQDIPDAPGVAYYSIGGRSNFSAAPAACRADEPGFISNWDDYVDPTGVEFVVTAPILDGDIA